MGENIDILKRGGGKGIYHFPKASRLKYQFTSSLPYILVTH